MGFHIALRREPSVSVKFIFRPNIMTVNIRQVVNFFNFITSIIPRTCRLKYIEYSFAFIIHPIDPKRDVSRKFPFLGRVLTERQIDFFSTFFPPVYVSEIEGIRSEATGKGVKGWFVACPYTPRRMLELAERTVYRKIIQTGRMAEKLGADILGLGAFTSVIGDAGVTIANHLDIPVTTGDSFTVAMAVQAIREAACAMNINIHAATVAIVGATGTIGRVASAAATGRSVPASTEAGAFVSIRRMRWTPRASM